MMTKGKGFKIYVIFEIGQKKLSTYINSSHKISVRFGGARNKWSAVFPINRHCPHLIRLHLLFFYQFLVPVSVPFSLRLLLSTVTSSSGERERLRWV